MPLDKEEFAQDITLTVLPQFQQMPSEQDIDNLIARVGQLYKGICEEFSEQSEEAKPVTMHELGE